MEAWVNEVQAQYHELKLLSFDLDALCVNVMLNGLPKQFASFLKGLYWGKNPGIKDIWVAALRINAGQINCASDSALAAKMLAL